jgi:hypothetical protein
VLHSFRGSKRLFLLLLGTAILSVNVLCPSCLRAVGILLPIIEAQLDAALSEAVEKARLFSLV